MKYNERLLSGTGLKILYSVVGILLFAAVIRFSMNLSYFHISTVDMVGVRDEQPLKYVNKEQLFEKLKPYLSGSYFHINLDKAQETAMQTEWVSDVKIQRILPSTVRLTIKEHEPVAVWIREGKTAGLVDSEGKIFQAAYQGKLPEFDGEVNTLPQMATQFKNFNDELHPLRLSILRLQYTPRAAWTMMLNNGIELRLGKQDVNTRMARFVTAWQHSLREHASALDYVDMRYSDGFATRNRAGAVSRPVDADIHDTPEDTKQTQNVKQQ